MQEPAKYAADSRRACGWRNRFHFPRSPNTDGLSPSLRCRFKFGLLSDALNRCQASGRLLRLILKRPGINAVLNLAAWPYDFLRCAVRAGENELGLAFLAVRA